jgi:hypothetical protein
MLYATVVFNGNGNDNVSSSGANGNSVLAIMATILENLMKKALLIIDHHRCNMIMLLLLHESRASTPPTMYEICRIQDPAKVYPYITHVHLNLIP